VFQTYPQQMRRIDQFHFVWHFPETLTHTL
jgi:hypothetical protein